MCNQLQTVDEERLDSIMCKLTSREMDEVDGVLRRVLSLQVDAEKVEELPVVEEPLVVVEDTEKIRLQVELDLYKKLYSDLTSQIVDARFERQVVAAPKMEEEIVATVVEEIPVVEPKVMENIVIDDLVTKMFTPNDEMVVEKPEKKVGRPKGSKTKSKSRPKNYRPPLEELVKHKKSEKANINTDTWETIAATTGMSVQTAQEIVRWRNKHGAYIDLTDLLFVPRFGSGCMNKYGQMLEA